MTLCKDTDFTLPCSQDQSCEPDSLDAGTAEDALSDVTMMRDRLSWAMDELQLKRPEKQQWLSHLHFATLPLSGLSDVGANFIPYLVSVHPSVLDSSTMSGTLALSASLKTRASAFLISGQQALRKCGLYQPTMGCAQELEEPHGQQCVDCSCSSSSGEARF